MQIDMKVTELRIGNLIDVIGTPIPVTSRTLYHIDCGQFKKFKPITLTEEWLLKFGLEADNGIHNEHFSGLIKLRHSNNGFYLGIGVIEDLKEVEYVHQLQNLYFALTGEELTIK